MRPKSHLLSEGKRAKRRVITAKEKHFLKSEGERSRMYECSKSNVQQAF